MDAGSGVGHGDMAASNILFADDGEVSALLDFDQACAGDPVSDLSVVWFAFNETERDAFYETYQLDAELWDRSASWALWRALTAEPARFDNVYWRDKAEVLEELAALA